MNIKKNGKVINLTESDLKKIVKKVLKEQYELYNLPEDLPPDRTGTGGDFNPLKHLKKPNFQKGATDKKKVLFVGDSQSANGWSYANQLLKSGLIHKDSLNKAVGGKKTSDILIQLTEALKKGVKYDIINIMGGGNNAGDKDDGSKAKSDLQSMYGIAKNHGAIVVAISNPNKNWTNKELSVKKTNNKIAQFVNDNPPNTDIVIDANNPKIFKVSAYNKDRVHLNKVANTVLKNTWVNKVLKT
ncbi:MAG: SGNH/GDSL hydrolase family protein [Candidatus Hodarchaeales archaeon]|jgi:hypothetical protein